MRVDEYDLCAKTLAEGLEAPHETFRIFADPTLGQLSGFTSYLAEFDCAPVGTGMVAIFGGLTDIFNISTLPRHRRQCYGRAATMELIQAGDAAGAYLYASIGESVYEPAGFSTDQYLTVITASE